MPAASQLRVLRDPAQAATLLHPARQRILRALQEPQSASGLAREFALPRQQVNYHLRELENGGFVELVEERRKGNCMERVVQATAKTYLISPEALGELGEDASARRDRFSAAYLIATAARLIRELAVVGLRARRAGKRISTLAIETDVRFGSAEDRNAFAEELANTLARLTARYHSEGATNGRTFRFVVGAYPAITRNEDDGAEASVLD
jgi:DNA-binding transcriptional ArsR family regulator